MKQTHEYTKPSNVFYENELTWSSLVQPVKYPKLLNDFCKEVENDTLIETIGRLDSYFTHSNIFLILKICEIENPDWDDFGLPAQAKDQFMEIYCRKKAEDNLKSLYFEMWQHKLSNLKSKKHVWNILKQTSGYSKSLTTFYKDVGNCELTDTIKLLNDHFIYPNILLILKLCEIEYPDWDELGLMPSDAKKFQNMYALN